MSSVDKLIEFYSNSPDGQYDEDVVRHMDTLKDMRDRLTSLRMLVNYNADKSEVMKTITEIIQEIPK